MSGEIHCLQIGHSTIQGTKTEIEEMLRALLQNSAGKGFTFGIHAVRRAA